jgi:hypothetical protein
VDISGDLLHAPAAIQAASASAHGPAVPTRRSVCERGDIAIIEDGTPDQGGHGVDDPEAETETETETEAVTESESETSPRPRRDRTRTRTEPEPEPEPEPEEARDEAWLGRARRGGRSVR